MDESRDFIEWVGQDMSVNILNCLEDPSDLVRASAVSRSWRHFVISNGLSKGMCLRMFPETSMFTRVIEVKNMFKPVVAEVDDSSESARLQREHRAFSYLIRCLTVFSEENCISNALFASSTDNYPEESVKNTLQPSDRLDNRASYWSSKGAANPAAPETLLYRLASQLCLITEVHVHPFQAYFQIGFPIYSAKAVRFRMGHAKVNLDIESEVGIGFLDVQDFSDDKFVWTYCSPEFPMAQDNSLQKFKLPEPILCIGGILKVELLGRVQTQEMDGLYYICINHVQVVGRPLYPVFDVEMINEKGHCALKYTPESTFNLSSPAQLLEAGPSSWSHLQRFSESIRTWEQMILNTFRGAGPLMIDDYDSDYELLD
ncbi:F-box protein At4g00755-like [Andrographis paniculata]|uniref:F-box protein At4g00755-like n=1 Tax=Andrographis paniculata TaxID=175694 RepID=UPI0021E8B846|nr:F-box protein At4g00755-like [Andrographis paniculata]